MRLRSILHRRPSASIIISCAALFLSLGGVGYAATTLAANSVTTASIKNGAVTYQKVAPNSIGKVRLANGGVTNAKLAHNSVSYKDIQAGAVGTVRANLNQLQARLKTTCVAGSAIGSVDNKGNVVCNQTLPAETTTLQSTAPVTLSGTAALVASATLASGSDYLVFSNPQISATSAGTAVRETISCTLAVANNLQTRTAYLNVDGTTGDTSTVTLPLQVAGGAGVSGVTCTASTPTGSTVALPATSALGGMNAIATAPTSGTTGATGATGALAKR